MLKKCTICGSRIKQYMYFCPVCGHRLRQKNHNDDNDIYPYQVEFISKPCEKERETFALER